jgi:hypothetical protein
VNQLEIFVILVAVGVLVFVIEVVRRRRLSEGYALLWIAVGFAGVLLGVSRHLIDRLSDSVGVSYGANLVFAGVFLFLLVVCINLSMHVSKLEDEVATLAEELALVNGRLDALAGDAVDLRAHDEPTERPLV